MEVNYTMQKMNDLNQEGKTLLIPRIILRGQCSIRSLAKEMEKYSTFSRSEIMGVLTLLGEMMTYKMASRYSVKLDEIGTFTPTLSLEKNRKGETANPERTNARRIGVSKKWSRTAGSGITVHGRGSHKVYVRCLQEDIASE